MSIGDVYTVKSTPHTERLPRVILIFLCYGKVATLTYYYPGEALSKSTMAILEFSYLMVVLTPVLLTAVAETPSPDLPQWTVKDDNDKICMLMAMNATIKLEPEVPIPDTATAFQQTGSCDSKMALFTLEFTFKDGFNYQITTSFSADENYYKMIELNVTKSDGFSFLKRSYEDSSFPSASIGDSMTCQKYDCELVYFNEYQFQPFAQQSKEQYGKAEACKFGFGPLVYVVFVAIVFVFVAAVVAIVLVVVKVVKSRRGYSEIQ
ncbi:hypothetical protein HOLleu_27420 [Holothuria leucospilota]|uniref:Uncharacterized protein n=1 Tax=Holothuria leucospilota TaxID=206669 RepID=A0A9Q1BQM1_HOLLE|nr:hypothetical protein HOLleu_27420 [Holothuria leucospilota]